MGIEVERMDILEQMKNFRPRSTIFEIGNTAKNKQEIAVMNQKRKKHADVIEKAALAEEIKRKDIAKDTACREKVSNNLDKSSQEDISDAFETVIEPKKVSNPKKAFPAVAKQ